MVARCRGAAEAFLEAGREDVVLSELQRFRAELHPTYENRANFDKLSQEAAERIKTAAEAK